jgi:hypothetical protein
MKMFHWSSEALKGFSDGDIIVIAKNETEARDKVRTNVLKKYPSLLKKFEKDISSKPFIVTDDVMLVSGSD